MSKKKKINEGLLGGAKKFSDAFFDGLKNNKANAITTKAKQAGMDRKVLDQMEKIKREKDELDKILADMPKLKSEK
jgi:hypothetical protein